MQAHPVNLQLHGYVGVEQLDPWLPLLLLIDTIAVVCV